MPPKKFQGELMTCVVCGRQSFSHPQINTQWRYLDLDASGFYACPDEFPPDSSGETRFQAAYQLVLAVCMNEALKQEGKSGLPEVEAYRNSRAAKAARQPKGFGRN